MTKLKTHSLMLGLAGGLSLIAAATATSAPSHRPAARPPAADGSLGMALFSAHVGSDGALLGGSGAVSAAKTLPGVYRIEFRRSLAGCFFGAASDYASGGDGAVPVGIVVEGGDSAVVDVTFRTLGGPTTNPMNTDSAFRMTVYCGSGGDRT